MGSSKPRKKPCSEGKNCCGWTPCQRSKVKSGELVPTEITGKAMVILFEEAREKLEKKNRKKKSKGEKASEDKKSKKDKKEKKAKKTKKK